MTTIREILVVPHAHHDMGYTHVPDVCMTMHERSIAQVIELCHQPAPDDAATFRWTMEITQPLLNFLHSADQTTVKQLQELVAAGRIAITGGLMHMTQLIGHEEAIRFFKPVHELRTRYDFPVSVVQHGDINGLSWGTVPLMSQLELNTLVMALNPDHGRAPFEQPSAFFWEGQDGSRVLVWLSLFYSLAHNRWGLTLGHIHDAVKPLQQMVNRLEERDDYPFDFAIIHSADDNMLPNTKICDAVERWNAQNITPPLRIVTIDEAMRCVHEQAENLPVHRGEWADWWSHGHGSSAYEVGISRTARAAVRTADIARTLSIQTDQPPADMQFYELPIVNWYRVTDKPLNDAPFSRRIDAVYDNLLLFEEHTWGTFESFTHPHSLFTRAHWQQKAQFAYEAAAEAHNLAYESISDLALRLPQGEAPTALIVNPTSQPRTDLVTVRTPGVNHTVLVKDVPAYGARAITWRADTFDTVRELRTSDEIENTYYQLKIDAERGSIISLYDKASKREWVAAGSHGIGAILFEAPTEGQDHPSLTRGRHHFHPDTPGPKFTYTAASGNQPHTVHRTHYGTVITLHTSAPTMPHIETRITLHDAFKAVDVEITIDKLENYDMEGVYAAFPFALDKADFLLETANAVFTADTEQLPDTSRDWYSIQHAIGINGSGGSVLWATREAPLVQPGHIRTGTWTRDTSQRPGHVYAWLMNNLYFTNFKAAQGGRMTFNFRFTTDATPVDKARVRAWGDQFGNPMMGRIARVKEGAYEWLSVTPDTVSVQMLKPADSEPDAFVLRLTETAGQATIARIAWHKSQSITFHHTDILESTTGDAVPVDGNTAAVTLEPYQICTLKSVRNGR